jgi:hypothetical protein
MSDVGIISTVQAARERMGMRADVQGAAGTTSTTDELLRLGEARATGRMTEDDDHLASPRVPA